MFVMRRFRKSGKVEAPGFFHDLLAGGLNGSGDFVQGNVHAGQGRCGDDVDLDAGDLSRRRVGWLLREGGCGEEKGEQDGEKV